MRVAALLLVVGVSYGIATSQQVAEFSSYYSGNRYDFHLTHEQLSSTPMWPGSEPNLPLSARAAQSAALIFLKTLFNDAATWKLMEINLVPVSERWVYLVSFTPPPRGCADCGSSPFRIPVTMDGTAVPAEVSEWRLPTPSVQ